MYTSTPSYIYHIHYRRGTLSYVHGICKLDSVRHLPVCKLFRHKLSLQTCFFLLVMNIAIFILIAIFTSLVVVQSADSCKHRKEKRFNQIFSSKFVAIILPNSSITYQLGSRSSSVFFVELLF